MSKKTVQDESAQTPDFTLDPQAELIRSLMMRIEALSTKQTSKGNRDEHPTIQALKASQAYVQATPGVKAAMVKDIKESLMSEEDKAKLQETRTQAAFKASETRRINSDRNAAELAEVLSQARAIAASLLPKQ